MCNRTKKAPQNCNRRPFAAEDVAESERELGIHRDQQLRQLEADPQFIDSLPWCGKLIFAMEVSDLAPLEQLERIPAPTLRRLFADLGRHVRELTAEGHDAVHRIWWARHLREFRLADVA